MTALRILLATLLLLPLTAAGDDLPLPDPPTGQVLDTLEWLDAGQRSVLETELGRIRERHGVDVLVVILNHAATTESRLGQLATQLGETWSREDYWAVVLHHPGSLHPPVATWGGGLPDPAADGTATSILKNATALGLKEWTDPARVSGIALNLAEELVFLRLQRQNARIAQAKGQARTDTSAKESARKKVIHFTLIAVGTLIVAALLVTGWFHLRSRPKSFTFPRTEWHRRLGANWSGGSNIVSTFTPPNGD